MFLRSNQFTIAIFVAIFLLCLLPGSEVPQIGHEHLDKALHAFLFGLLAYCMMIGFLKQYQYYSLARYAQWYTLIICLSYGVFLEVIQDLFLVDRSFEWLDIAADSVGTLVGYGFFVLLVQGKEQF